MGSERSGWRERARRLKVELFALYLAARHPQTPWYAKLVVVGFVAYAVTPVDPVLAECRVRAQERLAVPSTKPWLLIAAVWAALAAAGIALYI
jgi:hypothetical protein